MVRGCGEAAAQKGDDDNGNHISFLRTNYSGSTKILRSSRSRSSFDRSELGRADLAFSRFKVVHGLVSLCFVSSLPCESVGQVFSHYSLLILV